MNESIRDIVRRGVEGADIRALQTSPLHDLTVIRDIIKDTASVSFILSFTLHEFLTTVR